MPALTLRKRIGLIAAVFFSGTILPLLAGLFLRGLGAVLVIADPVERADAALILSGSDNTRINEAARLYQDNLIHHVILTEEGIELPDWDTSYSNLMRFRAIELGIPENAILITEKHVASTLDEARASLKLLRQRGFSSVIVITDPYHTLRTRLIFNKAFGSDDIKVMVHPTTDHWYKSKSWWLKPKGWGVTALEYAKIFGFLLGMS